MPGEINPVEDSYQVSGISWSCNGRSLAVAYGKPDHTSWCEHQSVICVWHVFRRDFNTKKPDLTIEVSNCVTCVNFHPSK